MSFPRPLPLVLLLLLFLAANSRGQTNAPAAGATTATTSATPPPHAPSADVINDWLRGQWPEADPWDLGMDIRAQYDHKSNAGSFPDSAPDADFIRLDQFNHPVIFYLREKVHLGYQHEWFNAFVEGRDSSSSGDPRNPNPFADQFDLHQAYVTLGNPKTLPFSFRVGRQQLSYGDERFVEKADWNNLERTFDAAKVRYDGAGLWVDAFISHYVIPDNGRFNTANWHDYFSGIYASSRNLINGLETDLYFLAHNVDDRSATITNTAGVGPAARDVFTPGLRVKSLPGEFHGWDFGTEMAGQFGSVNQGGVRLDHQAMTADALVGFTFTNCQIRPRLGANFTYGSGDNNPTDKSHQTFDLLFGAAHKFYGIMDVTGIRNTISPSVNLTVQAARNLSLRADYFLYWLADTHDLSYAEVGKGRTLNGYGINPGFSSFFGSEVDLVANYAATRFLNLQAGYSHFFVGDYIEQSVNLVPANGGAVDADYFYLQLKLKF